MRLKKKLTQLIATFVSMALLCPGTVFAGDGTQTDNISGDIYLSGLTANGNYKLVGNCKLYIDTEMTLGSIQLGDNGSFYNLTIEERANIFREKAEILKNLIYTEPIDKLKTLEFTFKKMPKKSKTKKTKNFPKTEGVVINEPEKTEQVAENDNSVDSMMELAKSMTEEQE